MELFGHFYSIMKIGNVGTGLRGLELFGFILQPHRIAKKSLNMQVIQPQKIRHLFIVIYYQYNGEINVQITSLFCGIIGDARQSRLARHIVFLFITVHKGCPLNKNRNSVDEVFYF